MSGPSRIAAMLGADFRMCREAADELRDAYEGTDYPRPTVADVIEHALDVIASDVEDRAFDLAECGKVDDCTAEAVVLRALVELLRGAS